jgi:phosphate butyryltransferase
MTLTSLNNLVSVAANNGRKRVVVAVAQDEDVLLAIKSASEAGIATPLLVGDKQAIEIAAERAGYDLSGIEIIHEADSQKACIRAAGLIKEARADIIMKGLVSTTTLMRVLLDKDQGIMNDGLLSHVAFFETPYYHKIICITDAALNIAPDLNEKTAIIKNAVDACHKLGMKIPCVAILAPVETVNPKIESTLHAALLSQMQKRNQIQGCIIDGPLALDNAVSLKAAEHKGLKSEVAGNADILVVPDLNAGNILYKSLVFLGGAVAAAIVAGASVPVVLTSRADNDRSKFLSIALAASLG